MKYEIVNPSDEAYLEHADPKVAIAACLVLGRGYYGLKDPDGKIACPVVAFGGTAELLADTFGGKEGFASFLDAHRAEMAEAFESVALAGDRTSMNDIKAAAAELAANYRKAASRPQS